MSSSGAPSSLMPFHAQIELLSADARFDSVRPFLNLDDALTPLEARIPAMIDAVVAQTTDDKARPSLSCELIATMLCYDGSKRALSRCVIRNTNLTDTIDAMQAAASKHDLELLEFVQGSPEASGMVMRSLLANRCDFAPIIASNAPFCVGALDEVIRSHAEKTGLSGFKELLELKGDPHSRLLRVVIAVLDKGVVADPHLQPILDEANTCMARYSRALERLYGDRQIESSTDEEGGAKPESPLAAAASGPTDKLSILRQELSRSKRLAAGLTTELSDREGTIRTLQKKDKASQKQIESLRQKLSQLEADDSQKEILKLQTQIDQQVEVILELRRTRDNLRKTISRLEKKVATLQSLNTTPDAAPAAKKKRADRNRAGGKARAQKADPSPKKRRPAVKKADDDDEDGVNHSLLAIAGRLPADAHAKDDALAKGKGIVIDFLGKQKADAAKKAADAKKKKPAAGDKDEDPVADEEEIFDYSARPAKKAKPTPAGDGGADRLAAAFRSGKGLANELRVNPALLAAMRQLVGKGGSSANDDDEEEDSGYSGPDSEGNEYEETDPEDDAEEEEEEEEEEN